jgi:hypothetical protein
VLGSVGRRRIFLAEIVVGLVLIMLAVFRFAQGDAAGIIEGLFALAAGFSGAAFGVLMYRAERRRSLARETS